MDCRRDFATSRLEVLLGEDDCRSSSRAHDAEVLCVFHNCMWISRHSEVNVYFSSSCVNEPVLRLRFRLRLCLYLHVQQTLAHKSLQVSPFLSLCFRSQTSLVSKPGGCSLTGPPVLDNWVFDFGWICWESLLPPATSESNSFIQLYF